MAARSLMPTMDAFRHCLQLTRFARHAVRKRSTGIHNNHIEDKTRSHCYEANRNPHFGAAPRSGIEGHCPPDRPNTFRCRAEA
jgi:hypothetical protein